jgi:putative salt-induced outer membrane protein
VSIDRQQPVGEYTGHFLPVYRIFNSNDTVVHPSRSRSVSAAEVVGGATKQRSCSIISSNLYAPLTDTVYITNDTDVIYLTLQHRPTTVLNVALTDTLHWVHVLRNTL